jgi:HK97 family phage major capsid protein
MESEGRFVIEQSLDAHVLAQIVAAAPPFGTTGATLVDKIRNGVAAMRATGANPTIVVLNPTDAAALDLLADAGGYVFPLSAAGGSSPLWGLRVVERIGAGNEPPYLIDPTMLGVLYLGSMQFDADPYTGFTKNLTTLRVETSALLHVRNANGARRIAAA